MCILCYNYVISRVIDHDSNFSYNNTPANQDRQYQYSYLTEIADMARLWNNRESLTQWNQGKRPNIEGGMAIQVEADVGCVHRREADALVPAKMATAFPRIE